MRAVNSLIYANELKVKILELNFLIKTRHQTHKVKIEKEIKMIKLNKKSIKSLSLDKNKIPTKMTFGIAGGAPVSWNNCTDFCTPSVGEGCKFTNLC
ncbi:hypothetical protein N476_26190 [Pseudoalteromonas luteoviolacea H33]|uniref:Uncharacterized protein n=1 Tax=Pseudoalteromonas luteoviolacea H33 TaxID=1365251 RepID=A0A162A5Y9_9GAMM|nr:hypothetical protein N476_26190 [Pseudoalteromonas luteoviolacea H33]KZN71973.1 hypothetical protein N477_25535 [Pseudoalteromonas luteoviolacea H33-S]